MKQKFHQLRINTNKITTLLIEELPTEPCLGQSVTYWRQKTEVSDDKTSDRMSKCHRQRSLYFGFVTVIKHLPSVLGHCWLGIRKSIRHVKIE